MKRDRRKYQNRRESVHGRTDYYYVCRYCGAIHGDDQYFGDCPECDQTPDDEYSSELVFPEDMR